jgi:hypothetical protein
MPRVFRAMREDGGLPAVGTEPRMLGPAAKDITADAQGLVHPGFDGISVAPTLRDLPTILIPKRLRHIAPKATGSNTSAVWRHGDGSFADEGAVAPDLQLRVDLETHGVIAPANTMPLLEYAAALAATRADWVKDET